MLYLDNAATSFPKAPGVGEAMEHHLARDAANPGRAGHRMAVAAERMLDDCRLKLTRFFDGEDPARMVFALNCTDALNMGLKGVLEDRRDRPHVITTVLEHNSVSRPLVSMKTSGRIELSQVDCDGGGAVDPADIRAAIRPSTCLIVMTHASNVLGTVQAAAEVGAIAREHDLLFLLDAAQTAGVIPISIRRMQVDLLAFPGHKSLLGPPGTGGLYVGPRCPGPVQATEGSQNPGAPCFTPWREGGTGGDSASPTQPAQLPHFLEGGTPNTVGIAGLGAAVDFLNQQAEQGLLEHERALCERILGRLGSDRRFHTYGSGDAASAVGTVSVNVQGYDAADVGAILDESFQIAVRPGLHCAPYMHRRLGTFPGGTVRISPGPFNTEQDVDKLLDALEEIAETG